MTPVEIQVSISGGGINPNVLAPLNYEGELLVRCDLIKFFDVDDVVELWLRSQISFSWSGSVILPNPVLTQGSCGRTTCTSLYGQSLSRGA